jgi:hypothetical protein
VLFDAAGTSISVTGEGSVWVLPQSSVPLIPQRVGSFWLNHAGYWVIPAGTTTWDLGGRAGPTTRQSRFSFYIAAI